MAEQSKLPIKEQSDSKQRKTKDPRHLITPDAFTVADNLLGLPLASPKKRAAAMIIDLIIIQQLSQMGSLILGLSIALVLFLLSRSKGRKAVGSSRNSIFKIMALILLFYIIAVETWSYYQTKEFSIFNSSSSIETVTEKSTTENIISHENLPIAEQLSIAQEEIAELKDENNMLKTNDNSDLMDMFEAIARKFGYGFGWAGVYFTLFVYLLKGQTPGKFLLRIRIIQLDGQKLTIWNSFARYGGYAASVVTGLSGFFQIFWDPNRQGLHDKVASTVVIREN